MAPLLFTANVKQIKMIRHSKVCLSVLLQNHRNVINRLRDKQKLKRSCISQLAALKLTKNAINQLQFCCVLMAVLMTIEFLEWYSFKRSSLFQDFRKEWEKLFYDHIFSLSLFYKIIINQWQFANFLQLIYAPTVSTIGLTENFFSHRPISNHRKQKQQKISSKSFWLNFCFLSVVHRIGTWKRKSGFPNLL